MRLLRAIVFVLATGWFTVQASAQPAHPVHKYMAGEHVALESVRAAVADAFRPVYIHAVELPDTVWVGDDQPYSVLTNVETATLPIRVRWDFGDGRSANGLHVRHSFEEPGTYDVTVTASNRRSETSRTVTVIVRPPDE